DASGGSDDQADRGAAQRGRVPHAKIPEGLHEHVGAKAVVPWRADQGEDRDQATRSPRVVAAGPGPRASNVSEQAPGLGAAWLGALPAGSATRSVGYLGRRAGTTAVAEAPGSLETGQGRGSSTVSEEGHPLIILGPIDPCSADRWDR